MHSLFGRARTTSTPSKKFSGPPGDSIPAAHGLDDLEFGRIRSRGSTVVPSITLGKKDKKKAEKHDKDRRVRTLSSPGDHNQEQNDFDSIPDGTFLPTSFERTQGYPDAPKDVDYGFLSYERHVVLGLDQVARLVEVVGEELSQRGLTTPFIFSTIALDISSSAVKRLIQAFLNTCALPGDFRYSTVGSNSKARDDPERRWREEASYAGPHELGMCLRWGLARVVRLVGRQDVRGLIPWEHYCNFRDSEAALHYPPSHFATFLPDLDPQLRNIILTVLTLLTRLTAQSASSGHTPPTLSPLFGPLLFGLGPATLAFHHTYMHYLRAVNATEHILLAFIRLQDTPRPASVSIPMDEGGIFSTGNTLSNTTTLGVPTRLKDWIRGYPAMLPHMAYKKDEKPQPRRGARTARVISVRRNVRMYSPDLVKSGAAWARTQGSGPTTNTSARGLVGSKEWDRIAPATLKLPARYAEGYKKRMDMPQSFHPDSSSRLAPSTSSSTSSRTLVDEQDFFGLSKSEYSGLQENDAKYGSLTDLKWGEFESMGFGGLGGSGEEKKLQFDLTEGARTARTAKRQTLNWNDFSTAGFTRSDTPLNDTLQFSTPVLSTISAWPAHQADIAKKLKKTQKALPTFGWDTEAIVGKEEVIEEAFVDVFCDLVYGGGWLDLERGEELDRECNWALVEFKSLPDHRTTITAGSDPRTATSLILFEEFVPFEYRQQLALKNSNRTRFPSLFSRNKQWKQATTLNGRPYVVGHVPNSPSYREVEFEGLLRNNGSGTKVVSLGIKPSGRPAVNTAPSAFTAPEPPFTPRAPSVSSPLYVEHRSDSPSPMKKSSRFRLPGGPAASPGRTAGLVPSESSAVEFETRVASGDDDSPGRNDAWVDILINTNARRMGGQDAQMGGSRARKNDPDLASLEVAQVLAGVRGLSDDEEDLTPVTQLGSWVEDTTSDGHGLAYDEPGSSVGHHDSEEASSPPKRLGYFDIHPDRKPPSEIRVSEDDPRDRLGDSEDEDEDQYEKHIAPTVIAPVVEHQLTPRPTPALFEPERRPSPTPPVAEPDRVVSPLRLLPKPPQPTQIPAPVGPRSSSPLPPAPAVATPPANTASPSKTSALIEMYREREKGKSPLPVQAPQPSRLPVRAAALTQHDANLNLAPLTPKSPPRSLSPGLPKSPAPVPAPPVPVPAAKSTPAVDDLPLPEPSRVHGEETGRASPMRYVHGAPLQNVFEEEEED